MAVTAANATPCISRFGCKSELGMKIAWLRPGAISFKISGARAGSKARAEARPYTKAELTHRLLTGYTSEYGHLASSEDSRSA